MQFPSRIWHGSVQGEPVRFAGGGAGVCSSVGASAAQPEAVGGYRLSTSGPFPPGDDGLERWGYCQASALPRVTAGEPLITLLFLLSACLPHEPAEPGDIVGDAEAWYRTFGGANLDESWGIDLADNGDLFVSTHQGNPSLGDAFIYRLTAEGEIVWETQWGGTWTEEAFSVEEQDGVVHVGGCRFEGFDLWDTEATLLRLDADSGEVLEPVWSHDDEGTWNEIDGILITEDSVFMSGWGGSEDGDMLMVELDRQGQQQQLVGWGGEGFEEGNGHVVSVGGLLYVVGRSDAESVWAGGDAVLVAFDMDSLEEAWSVTWGEPDTMEDALNLGTDGEHLYVIGMQEGDEAVFFLAYDLEGNLLWERGWDGGGVEYGRSIRVDEHDGSIVVGMASDGEGDSKDIVLLRLDPEDGQVLEQASWGGDKDEEIHDLRLQGDTAYLVGQTESYGNGSYDGLVMRFTQRPWTFPE